MTSEDTLVEQGESVSEMLPDKEKDLEMSSERGSGGNDADSWDGPEDPANPMNWPKWKRQGHVTMVAAIVFIVSVSYNCASEEINSDLL
jgi:hypothetical protein